MNTLNHSSEKTKLIDDIKESLLFWLILERLPIELRVPLLHMRHLEGKTLLIPSIWRAGPLEDHVVGIGILYDPKLNKTCVSITNRGAFGLAPCLTDAIDTQILDESSSLFGTAVYSVERQLNLSFFSDLCSPYATTSEEFRIALNEELAQATLHAILPAKPQGYPTCSYVNPKRDIEGLKLCEALTEGHVLNEALIEIV